MKKKRRATRPPGYWDDFANVERELREYMRAHACGDAFPTQSELERDGLSALPAAIARHGGVLAVAERLGLSVAPPGLSAPGIGVKAPTLRKRWPKGYWLDPANLERELRAFVANNSLGDQMPTHEKLVAAGRWDLNNAIYKHGGREVVAGRMGLECAPQRRRRGYWQDFANVERELLEFVAEHGEAGTMPRVAELLAHGLAALSGAISAHGGYTKVAERLGLRGLPAQHPAGYWHDFANVEREIRAFADEHGLADGGPTKAALVAARRHDLMRGIGLHGGLRQVAGRLGLGGHATRPDVRSVVARPPGYWADFSHVEAELRTFIADHGQAGVMPTSSELAAAGWGALTSAIGLHGGFPAVAERLGLERPHARRPVGYWDDFGNVERELRDFISMQPRRARGRMPTQAELGAAGCEALLSAIAQHGGTWRVADRLGLAHAPDSHRPKGYWEDFSNVERELLAYIAERGDPGMMPTYTSILEAGFAALGGAILKHGGVIEVSRRLGLARPSPRLPDGYYDDFAVLERELRAYVAEHSLTTMPTLTELRAEMRNDLSRGIREHGGFPVVARRLGLAPRSELRNPPGYWDDFANVERQVREYLATTGTGNAMPRPEDLIRAGRGPLGKALARHGGAEAVAARLGLNLKPPRHRRSRWEDFATLEREVRAFVRKARLKHMPTQAQLLAARRSDLYLGVVRHGGLVAVAQRLGYPSSPRHPSGYWEDFANLERELRAFMELHNPGDVLPSHDQMRDGRRLDLVYAIRRHGGVRAVARRLGLIAACDAPPLPKSLRVKPGRRKGAKPERRGRKQKPPSGPAKVRAPVRRKKGRGAGGTR